jgi:hypothetical protein
VRRSDLIIPSDRPYRPCKQPLGLRLEVEDIGGRELVQHIFQGCTFRPQQEELSPEPFRLVAIIFALYTQARSSVSRSAQIVCVVVDHCIPGRHVISGKKWLSGSFGRRANLEKGAVEFDDFGYEDLWLRLSDER